ncbi:MAG: hydantoinase B/oxoprolinase family protein [Thiotrichales bacterium]|nr:hydantoinase B/oxoprolinase family protein [Thiotrichales bacterium]
MSDIVSAAVIRESFASIVREMRRAVARSSYSSIIHEGYDFSCVLVDAAGRLVAQSGEDHPFHIIPVVWSVRGLIERGIEIDEDTLYLHNDPYTGGTHLNDVAVVYPLFHAETLLFHIVIRAHWADIGGMTPGSLSGAAREILQEGLRLDLVPVPKSGRSPVMDLILDNVRVSREADADFQAVIGTCRVAERRLRAVIKRYGPVEVIDAVDAMIAAAERRMRAAIAELPDGTYRYTAYLDGNDEAHFPLTVAVALTVAGDTAEADFAGTSAQVPAPLNAGPAIAPTSVLIVLKSFLDPAGVINSGTFAPIHVRVPEGTILSAVWPAPCGGLNEVRFAADAAVMGALSVAVPERMAGDVRGTSNHTYIGGVDSCDGQSFIFYEYPSGGGGGFAGHDGNPAVRAFNEGENVSIQSSEMVERIYPLRVLRSELRPGSGGPGRHRGGLGLRREIRVEAPQARLSILSDRNLVPPYGVNGGRSGAPNSFHVVSAGRVIAPSDFPGKVSDFPLERGDVLVMESSGGGGYGPASERSETEIRRDLAEGYVDEADLAVYGARYRNGELVREPVRDEKAGVRPVWLDDEVLASHLCRPGNRLATSLGLRRGQMVELAPPAGPPLRFWIDGFEASANTLSLAEHWRDRLPEGPFVLRAMPTGTPAYVRGAT